MTISTFLDALRASPIDVISQDPTPALELVKSHIDKVIKLYKKSDPTKKTDLEEISVDGLDANQVWWQTKIILDNVEAELMESIHTLGESAEHVDSQDEESDYEEISNPQIFDDQGDIDGFGQEITLENSSVSVDEDDLSLDNTEKQISSDPQEEEEGEEGEEEEGEEESNDENGMESLKVSKNQNEDAFATDPKGSEDINHPAEKKKHNLNNEFFNIDEFNRQTIEGEQNNVVDDDDSIDYFEDVPSDDEEEAIYYEDFFDKPSSDAFNKTGISEDPELNEEFTEADYETAVNSAKLDLFADDEGVSEELTKREHDEQLSSFEKQQLKIQKQIEELEKEAVAEKKWALKGEVKAQDRPDDALLTEEIEFDRTAKPVPVITTEVTENLEDMIRRRIKDENFDDLQRRTILDLQSRSKKPQFELSDQKSSKSLAEIYEDDYTGVPQDIEITEELQKSHDEISGLFKDLSYKLDALSSAHFIPKPPQKSLEVRVETDAVAMEDAQPLTMSNASVLAPQEIYKVGKADNSNEIRLKNGVIMSKDEISREEKSRIRRAIKRKRSKSLKEQRSRPSKQSKKDSVIETLSKAKNITVIDKKGEKSDVRGQKTTTTVNNCGNIKL